MKQIAKSTMMVAGGLVWLAVALVIGIFLFQNLGKGAGVSVFGLFGFEVSSMDIGFGVVHFVGFSAAACLCFVVGIGLCAHGLVPTAEGRKGRDALQKKNTAGNSCYGK